jgi:acyl-coenzyme A synthetase/AMP-(fatty) acid ligase
VSYGDLAVRVSRFAAALREAGMKPGDRVAMLMLDHADLVSIYLAVIAAGGVAVTLSTRATSDDLRHMLAIVRPFAVIAESEFAPPVAAGMAPGAKLFLRQRDLRSWVQRSEMEFMPCVRRPDDPAYWVMTSGRTGQPKAVEHRHDNVFACTSYLVRGLAATAADRFFPTSRLNFAYALGAMFSALRLGATLVLHERWPTPSSIAATVELNRPSIILSVPTLHKFCESGFPSQFAFRAVRCYVSAGERLPPRIGVEWEKATGRPIIDAMSCSELVHKMRLLTRSPRRRAREAMAARRGRGPWRWSG